MKVKVKGLVFVGFAAMIFAANAMAADNTVTSKQYVDTHFQVKSGGPSIGGDNGAWNPLDTTIPTENASTTTAPTTAAVRAALNNATNIDNFVEDTITDGVTTKAPSENAVHDALALKEDAANKVTSVTSTSNDTQYPSAKAVYDALHNTANVGNGALTVTVDGGTVTGTFEANQASGSTIAITGLESQSNKVGTIDTTATAEQKAANYPSQAAVEAYVADATDVDNFVEDTITDGVTTKAPSENAVHDALALKVDIAQGAGAANKTLVTDANGNVTVSSITTAVIPAIDPAVCNATTPCALVTNESTGAAEWQPIAQATANVGE